MSGLIHEAKVSFRSSGAGGRKELVEESMLDEEDTDAEEIPCAEGRIPRVSKLMALAIHFEELLHKGEAHDQVELARFGQVTRARMSQIMSLLHLAPDIQEALLFMEPVTQGRDPIQMRDLLPITQVWKWSEQRTLWKRLAHVKII